MITQNHTMKTAKYLYSIAVLIICIQLQKTDAKEVNYQKLCGKYALVKPERNLRDIKDVWLKIRESAINSWIYVTSIAIKTKEKINKFIDDVKIHAIDLKNKFDEKLQELNDRLKTIISDLYGTGELVKQCVIKEQKNMEAILKDIMGHMGECITEEINKLPNLGKEEETQPAMNQTEFIRELDSEIDLCTRDMNNVQECLCKVRENIFDNFTDMETKILNGHFESRNIIDDIKGTLVTCSLNNLIDATNLISTEMVEIAKCVLEAKEEENDNSIINEI